MGTAAELLDPFSVLLGVGFAVLGRLALKVIVQPGKLPGVCLIARLAHVAEGAAISARRIEPVGGVVQPLAWNSS